jgi:GNAT superfamily N-acetyltransferase
MRDGAGQIVGGLVGSTYWGWLSIAYFWIHRSWRGQGLGTAILRTAEEEAIRRGCYSAQVATFCFQNPEFYKANGYESYATLDDFPFGHRQYFFRKRLRACSGSSQPCAPK